jgi:hypothetical protein
LVTNLPPTSEILHYLYTIVLNYEDDGVNKQLLLMFFKTTIARYLEMVKNLVYFGELEDRFDEFPIAVHSSRWDKQNFDQFHKQFSIKEESFEFLRDLNETMLRTGRSLWILRNL